MGCIGIMSEIRSINFRISSTLNRSGSAKALLPSCILGKTAKSVNISYKQVNLQGLSKLNSIQRHESNSCRAFIFRGGCLQSKKLLPLHSSVGGNVHRSISTPACESITNVAATTHRAVTTISVWVGCTENDGILYFTAREHTTDPETFAAQQHALSVRVSF